MNMPPPPYPRGGGISATARGLGLPWAVAQEEAPWPRCQSGRTCPDPPPAAAKEEEVGRAGRLRCTSAELVALRECVAKPAKTVDGPAFVEKMDLAQCRNL